MKAVCLCLMLIAAFSAGAQKEFNVWHFGQHAGISFNSSPPQAINGGAMYTLEGCASICDSSGQLLFYSDGRDVWNRNHQVMPNGTGLRGNFSSSHSALIVPAPAFPGKYYLFTVDYEGHQYGLSYSIVDMNLDNGLGDITGVKNVSVVTPVCERLLAVRHANGLDFWIIVELYQSNGFHSYLLTHQGLQTVPVVSPVAHTVTNMYGTIGCIKASQDGTRIAAGYFGDDKLRIFDFDCFTGRLSNGMTFDQLTAYGVEFSRSGRYLYSNVSRLSFLVPDGLVYQYDLSNKSQASILASLTYVGKSNTPAGALQMGPDGRIYMAIAVEPYLGVINYPDSQGLACQLSPAGISLQGDSSMFGLPTFENRIQSYPGIQSSGHCKGDSVHFTFSNMFYYDSLAWNFSDSASGVGNASSLPAPVYIYQDTGTYHVTLKLYVGGYPFTVHHVVQIVPPIVVTLGPDTVICGGEMLRLSPALPAANVLWDDGSVTPDREVSSPGLYWVKVELNGCLGSDSILVDVLDCSVRIDMPNVFTPNGDNVNDRFTPISFENVHQSQLSVFNRWDGLVFSSDDLSVGWDGAMKGEPCPEGVYYWVIRCDDRKGRSREFSGTLTLMR